MIQTFIPCHCISVQYLTFTIVRRDLSSIGTVQYMLIDDDGIPADPMGSAATTFLIKERKSGYKGVITFLDEDSNGAISEFLFNTIAHESTHITDEYGN